MVVLDGLHSDAGRSGEGAGVVEKQEASERGSIDGLPARVAGDAGTVPGVWDRRFGSRWMTLKWKWKSWRVVWRGAVAAMILAVAGTWVWSYWYREKLGYLTESGAAFLATAERGQLFLGWRDMEATHPITTGTGMLRMRLPTDPYLIISTCAMGWVGSLEFDQAIMNTFGSTFSKRTGIGWFWSARSGTRPAGAPVAELSGLFGGSAVGIQTPFWLLMAALLVPAAITGVRRRKQRRPGEGLPCRKCGYDLRATPERCPECGEAAGT